MVITECKNGVQGNVCHGYASILPQNVAESISMVANNQDITQPLDANSGYLKAIIEKTFYCLSDLSHELNWEPLPLASLMAHKLLYSQCSLTVYDIKLASFSGLQVQVKFFV